MFLSSKLLEADDNGVKHMVLCRVILGKIEKVEAGSQQSHPSSTEFDTGVDDPTFPTRYIVWCSNMNRHILPEYIVSFKSTNCLPGNYCFLFGSFILSSFPSLYYYFFFSFWLILFSR